MKACCVRKPLCVKAAVFESFSREPEFATSGAGAQPQLARWGSSVGQTWICSRNFI